MKKIHIIEMPSDIGAGTRGSGMGVEALKIASLHQDPDFFSLHPCTPIPSLTRLLYQNRLITHNEFPFAKNINLIYNNLVNICESVSSVLESDEFPIVLSGDHSSAAGTIAGIKKAFPRKRLGVIWIDAHFDLHSPFTTPSGNMHGMPLGMVLAEDNEECTKNAVRPLSKDYWEKIKQLGYPGAKILPSDLVFIAGRDYEEEEEHIVEKLGIKNFTVEEVRQKGSKQIVAEVLERLKNCDLIYVSLDVDSIDPEYSSGTGTPVKGGLTIDEFVEINDGLVSDPRVACWEVVEINPTLDCKNKMAQIAFSVLRNVADIVMKRESILLD